MGSTGICGKRVDTAELQDALTGVLIEFARITEDNRGLVTSKTNQLITGSLFITVTNVSFDNDTIQVLINKIYAEKERFMLQYGDCTVLCEQNTDYDMRMLWEADEDIHSLKSIMQRYLQYHQGTIYKKQTVSECSISEASLPISVKSPATLGFDIL